MIKNIWFWFSTYKHKCPDGTVHRLHKSPDKAFPLALTDTKKHYEAVVKGLQGISEIGAKVINESNLNGLFIQIDKANNSMMPKFRSAYVLYTSEPCRGYEHFVRMVEKIQNEHDRIQNLLAKIEGLVNLAKEVKNEADYKHLVRIYGSIINELDGSGGAVVASLQIEESRELVREMLKK